VVVSTHPFLTPEWIDSSVVGGAKSSILRHEAVPSFLEAMMQEGGPEDQDDEIWCEAMDTVQGAGPTSGLPRRNGIEESSIWQEGSPGWEVWRE
jgi:hypothetical protein